MSFKKLLFVCMGNSCSSPMAEAIMQNLMAKTSIYWEVDSAGLRTWNTGRRPDHRCLRVLREHGLRSDHFCRQFALDDFGYFDYVVAMDETVYKELQLWANANRCRADCQLLLLSSFGPNGQPAFIHNLTLTSKQRLFRAAYYQIKECCKQLILLQKVDIVRYEVPSSEDDVYYGNQVETIQTSDYDHQAESSASNQTSYYDNQAEIAVGGSSKVEGYYSTTSQSTSDCPTPTPSCGQNEGTRRKQCQKCGQKFVAAL